MRARFTVGEIADHALAIVDRDGLGGLSMRTLARALGTGPMTLYNYVEDRGQLEALVAEAVIAGVELPEPSHDWAEDVRAVATAIWEAVRRHPNVVPLVLTRRTMSATSYAPAERLVEALTRGGLEGVDLLAAFRAVLALVMGSAQVELAARWPGRIATSNRRRWRRRSAGSPATSTHGWQRSRRPVSGPPRSTTSVAPSTCCWRAWGTAKHWVRSPTGGRLGP